MIPTLTDLGHLTEWIALVLGAAVICLSVWSAGTYLVTRRMR